MENKAHYLALILDGSYSICNNALNKIKCIDGYQGEPERAPY